MAQTCIMPHITHLKDDYFLSLKKEPKLRLINISKRYIVGEEKDNCRGFYAVQDFSLDIYDGEFICLVGPSGCGKSTIINLIAGFEKPDEGKIFCDNKEIKSSGPDRCVIFQENGLLPWLNLEQNIEFGLKILGLTKSKRNDISKKYLKMVHLLKFAKSYPFQLSGGMKQRVSIARALAVDPVMLLMDEPFSSLDPRTRDLLHLQLQQIWLETRKTVLFVSHSVEEALRLSDRIVIMGSQPGRIRRIVDVNLPHPRDFFHPGIAKLRAEILEELEDELNKLAKREGDDDWNIKEGSLRRRSDGSLAVSVGSGG